MARPRKDGLPSNHKGGRKTKAEEMGLEKRLNDAFKAVSRGKHKEGATEVLKGIWLIAADSGHPKQFEALKWITDRYYGKEPKAIIKETNFTLDRGTINEIFGGTFTEIEECTKECEPGNCTCEG